MLDAEAFYRQAIDEVCDLRRTPRERRAAWAKACYLGRFVGRTPPAVLRPVPARQAA